MLLLTSFFFFVLEFTPLPPLVSLGVCNVFSYVCGSGSGVQGGMGICSCHSWALPTIRRGRAYCIYHVQDFNESHEVETT